MKIEFYDLNEKGFQLKYVVICAMYQKQWIFVRHKDRVTWEVPGGHIEENESPNEAAARELKEETGAAEFQLVPICDYSVENSQGINYGRLYFAQVEAYEDLPDYEIAEIIFKDKLPIELTYKDIQPFLMQKVIEKVFSNKN
ncbi:MAG: NUDIX hydrolase [Bacillota bacterium]